LPLGRKNQKEILDVNLFLFLFLFKNIKLIQIKILKG